MSVHMFQNGVIFIPSRFDLAKSLDLSIFCLDYKILFLRCTISNNIVQFYCTSVPELLKAGFSLIKGFTYFYSV